VMRARERLKKVYGEESVNTPRTRPEPVSETLAKSKRAEKAQVMAQLRADYEVLKASWGGDTSYDPWFKRPINNARLNTIATYYHFVPAFQRLLANNGGDLQKFYNDAKALSGLEKEKRHARMVALAGIPRETMAAQ
jgi:predicted aminopeptidase